ncbi:MAG: DNA polymerase I, partial [Alphaproteobacteria bacterium]
MNREDGTPVNAVYGFITMLMNLIKENGCEHIVVIFDAKRKNFRNNIFAAYKENRKETPPELVPQFALIRRAVEAFNIEWVEMEGFEADDLIATYARIACKKGWHARVISADKDLMQLVNDKVSLYDPLKRKDITAQDVIAKFGVPPDKVVDVQSLMGDSVDNIPGATGIGPKTASELINTFGSLDNLLAHLSDIPQQRRREGLIRDTEQILISRRLVTLDTQVPVSEELERFRVQKPDYEKIFHFLKENNFNSLLEKTKLWAVRQGEQIDTALSQMNMTSALTVHYELIQDENALKKWIQKIKEKKYVAIDTETNSLNPFEARLVGFSLCCEAGKACYIPIRHGSCEQPNPSPDLFGFTPDTRPRQIPIERALALIRPILEDKEILKIGHNIKYDMHVFSHEFGADFRIEPIEDTMLISYTLYGTTHGHGMDELALRYLHHTNIKFSDVCGSGRKRITFDKADLENATRYAAEDADITLRLYQLFRPDLETCAERKIYDTLDLPLIQILFEMEQRGIMIDKAQLKNLTLYFDRELNRLTQEIYNLAGEEFNINSPSQLGVILFEKMKAAGGKKGSNGSWSTDIKVLERLATEGNNELAKKIIDYRAYAKLKNTYVDTLLTLLAPNHKRVHTSFSLTSTNTGRLASSDPNLQNIPIRTDAGKEIRKAFIAAPGYKLLCADYSQIELRLMADVANVTRLREALLHNEDIHAATAALVFKIPQSEVDADTRRRAKAINFGIIYGISAFGLSNQLGISRSEAKEYIDSYFEQYHEIKTYMKKTT